jgi:NAD+ kinase
MFNKILIIYKENQTKKHLATVDKVKAILKNADMVKITDLKEQHFKDKDLIITIGGDGTFIKAASFITSQYILGINSEPEFSEGALTSINESEIDFLNALLKDNFKVKEIQRIQVLKNNLSLKQLALNEVYIGTLYQFDTSRYKIKLDNHEEEHRSSGVLIATPSGSGAWYKSAGGEPFQDKRNIIRFLVREPFFGRLFKPKLIQGEITVDQSLFLESRRLDNALLALDSNITYPLKFGDKIEVKLSDQPLNVVIFK